VKDAFFEFPFREVPAHFARNPFPRSFLYLPVNSGIRQDMESAVLQEQEDEDARPFGGFCHAQSAELFSRQIFDGKPLFFPRTALPNRYPDLTRRPLFLLRNVPRNRVEVDFRKKFLDLVCHDRSIILMSLI
jgi:hypothetical protein